jgi:hypothetical protein
MKTPTFQHEAFSTLTHPTVDVETSTAAEIETIVNVTDEFPQLKDLSDSMSYAMEQLNDINDENNAQQLQQKFDAIQKHLRVLVTNYELLSSIIAGHGEGNVSFQAIEFSPIALQKEIVAVVAQKDPNNPTLKELLFNVIVLLNRIYDLGDPVLTNQLSILIRENLLSLEPDQLQILESNLTRFKEALKLQAPRTENDLLAVLNEYPAIQQFIESHRPIIPTDAAAATASVEALDIHSNALKKILDRILTKIDEIQDISEEEVKAEMIKLRQSLRASLDSNDGQEDLMANLEVLQRNLEEYKELILNPQSEQESKQDIQENFAAFMQLYPHRDQPSSRSRTSGNTSLENSRFVALSPASPRESWWSRAAGGIKKSNWRTLGIILGVTLIVAGIVALCLFTAGVVPAGLAIAVVAKLSLGVTTITTSAGAVASVGSIAVGLMVAVTASTGVKEKTTAPETTASSLKTTGSLPGSTVTKEVNEAFNTTEMNKGLGVTTSAGALPVADDTERDLAALLSYESMFTIDPPGRERNPMRAEVGKGNDDRKEATVPNWKVIKVGSSS